MRILQNINSREDLLRLTDEEKIELCSEIRTFLIENVSKTGGHLAGNLGTVELAVAIETVFDTRKDRLVYDVGHQSYVHKILTGRRDAFSGLRQFGGISGFPKPSESETDAFIAGHASSSVSIALGMARARTLLQENYSVVALIGDGAATGGMAYEGMNDAADSKEPMVIILNDNEMSIRKNVGGLSKHLSRIRSSYNYQGTKRWYRNTLKKLPGGEFAYQLSSRMKNRVKRLLLPTTLFESMGLAYLGPTNGHDLPGLIALLKTAKEMRTPVLVHVVTKKGYGYGPAEQDPSKFHGIGKFDPLTGEVLAPKIPTYSAAFGETMLELAAADRRVCAITAAMPDGTGLVPFAKKYPNRIFDVGIAEEHAVSMAGGLAKQGLIPVVALYSTFLQRAYDQLIQDIAMLHLHVVFAVDRAGLVGDDGPTHHGVFDVGFLRQIPGMLVLTPGSIAEQQNMLHWAVNCYDGPAAVRYPRGGNGTYTESAWNRTAPLQGQQWVVSHRCGKDITLLTYGRMLDEVLKAAEKLRQQGIDAGVLRLTMVSQIPVEAIRKGMCGSDKLIVIEETAGSAGIQEAVSMAMPECSVWGMDLGKDFVPHGSQQLLNAYCRLDAQSICDYVMGVLKHEK